MELVLTKLTKFITTIVYKKTWLRSGFFCFLIDVLQTGDDQPVISRFFPLESDFPCGGFEAIVPLPAAVSISEIMASPTIFWAFSDVFISPTYICMAICCCCICDALLIMASIIYTYPWKKLRNGHLASEQIYILSSATQSNCQSFQY